MAREKRRWPAPPRFFARSHVARDLMGDAAMRPVRPLIAVLIAVPLYASACAPPGGGSVSGASDGFVVPEGKQDDFLSLSAKEFVFSGRATVTLEDDYVGADQETRTRRLRELAGYQQIAIAWFLNQYLIHKEASDSNHDYGGFGAMSRANTYEELDLQPVDDRTYSFYYEQLVAGTPDLMGKLPLTEGEDGARELLFVMGNPSNEEMARLETNSEWYRSAPWSPWNPDAVDEARKQELRMTVRPEVDSTDAWLDFAALLEDGVLDVDVHFGWDYHSEYHVKHARSLFGWLTGEGFEAPAPDFESLTRQSGAFVKTLSAGGREVRVEVRIFYGKSGSETDPDTDTGGRALEDDMRASLATRDVIVYSGHSGPFYGFALANWRMTSEGDLDDTEMRSVEMPADRYQLVVAEGCDTYQIGEAFRNNPAKPGGRYVDVVTTTAPSNASSTATVEDILSRLLETNDAQEHDPKPLRALLRDLDRNSSWFHTMYGIHGIDDNPHLHPYAEIGNVCMPCASDAECGGPGNRCIDVGDSGKRCAPSCTTDAGCGGGYTCREVAASSTRAIYDSVCVPTDLGCGG